MEYYKNLNGHYVESKRTLIGGIIYLVFCIVYLVYSFLDSTSTKFEQIFPFFLLINGVFLVARAKGFFLLTKTFIEINDESLAIKTISKKKIVFWENVECVDFSDKKLRVLPEDKNFQYVELKMLEDNVLTEIIENVVLAIEERNIRIIKK